MNDPFPVRSFQSIRNLNRQVQQLAGFHWSPGKTLLQRLTLQQFHSDEGLTLAFVDLVNRADVRVVK